MFLRVVVAVVVSFEITIFEACKNSIPNHLQVIFSLSFLRVRHFCYILSFCSPYTDKIYILHKRHDFFSFLYCCTSVHVKKEKGVKESFSTI